MLFSVFFFCFCFFVCFVCLFFIFSFSVDFDFMRFIKDSLVTYWETAVLLAFRLCCFILLDAVPGICVFVFFFFRVWRLGQDVELDCTRISASHLNLFIYFVQLCMLQSCKVSDGKGRMVSDELFL